MANIPTNNNQPPTIISGTMPHHVRLRSKLSMLLVLLIVAGAVFGAIYYDHHRNQSFNPHQRPSGVPTQAQQDTAQQQGQYNYSYSGKTNSYSVAGTAAGQGMNFDVPNEFTGPTSGVTKQTFLSSSIFNGTTTLPLAEIAASSNPGTIVNALGAAAAEAFANTALGANYKASYGKAASFTAANIKANAWAVSFSATPAKQLTKLTQPPVKGKLVMVAGQNSAYYFIIYAANNNWDNNQKLWNQVFDSVKVDQ